MKKFLIPLILVLLTTAPLLAGGAAEYFTAIDLMTEMEIDELLPDHSSFDTMCIRNEFIDIFANNYSESELKEMQKAVRVYKELVETLMRVAETYRENPY